MGKERSQVGFPQRKPLRRFMQWLAKVAFWLLTDQEIIGQENFPPSGPLIVVANHFSFVDPAAVVRIAPWPLEFVGGAHMPHAPKIIAFIPRLWGYLPVYRGTGSHTALRDGEKIINRGGVLGVFPEGGNWAQVLRPARPGAAFLAAHTNAKLLPIGLHGMDQAFPTLFRGRRPKVTFRIGKPFGPFRITAKGRERRKQIDEIGHEIMRRIAALIPPQKRGHYSDDPAIREAAEGTEIYPWANKREGEVRGKVS
ncbi:MAG: lysophospholipid acyltransferase family protein [Anaerolineales bacterium]